jgi:hypothetical protein
MFDDIVVNTNRMSPAPKDIANHRGFCIGMPQLLRDEDVWYEAYRHIVGCYCLHTRDMCYVPQRKIEDLQEIENRELKYMVLEHREDLRTFTDQIYIRLQNLATFSDAKFNSNGQFKHLERQTFLARWPVQRNDRSRAWKVNGRNRQERFDHVARSIFGE